jgi:hypothetical protein
MDNKVARLEALLKREPFVKKRDNALPLPSEAEWEYCSNRLGTVFPVEFMVYMELMCYYDTAEIFTISNYDYLPSNIWGRLTPIWLVYEQIIKDDWWDINYIPFISVGNGDEYCLPKSQEKQELCAVYYFDHEDDSFSLLANSIEEWLVSTITEIGESNEQ